MPEVKWVSFRPMNKDDLVHMLKRLTDNRVLEFYGRDKKSSCCKSHMKNVIILTKII